jgi:hypothetical protein
MVISTVDVRALDPSEETVGVTKTELMEPVAGGVDDSSR